MKSPEVRVLRNPLPLSQHRDIISKKFPGVNQLRKPDITVIGSLIGIENPKMTENMLSSKIADTIYSFLFSKYLIVKDLLNKLNIKSD